MERANREAAILAFEALGITGGNRVLADYWLSLWHGDRLPVRAAFNPAAVSALLPGIGIFQVKSGVRAACRLAGTEITRAVGRDLSGLDWRQYTPQAQWQKRLDRNSAIALGQVGIGRRSYTDVRGRIEQTIELQLPFADEAEDGTRQILFHLDWRVPTHTSLPQQPSAEPQVADSFRAISLF